MQGGLTLPVWAVLSLYWLVAILVRLILTDPNPPKKQPDPPPQPPPTLQSSGKKPLTTKPQTPPPTPATTTPHEPLLVRFAISPTFLSLHRTTVIILPAAHLTLLSYLLTIPASSLPNLPFSSDLLCPYLPPNSPTFLHTLSPLTLLGILLVLLSAPLRLLCFYQLGPSFTFTLTPPKSGLVKSGLYKYVRHPSYTSALVSMVGFFLTIAAPGGVAMRCFLGEEEGGWGMGRVLVVGGFCVMGLGAVEVFRQRIIGEERFLHDMFWDEWIDYVGRTNKLVPWVY